MRTTWTEEQFRKAVKESKTYAEVLRKLGLSVRPGNYKTVTKYIKEWDLDTSHMTGQSHLKGKQRKELQRELTDILVQDSDYNPSHLKSRLLREGLLGNKCAVCGLEPEWQGMPLVLRLDHVNGDNRDARLENLRLLCPNCDSQTPTFCRGKRGVAQLGRAAA